MMQLHITAEATWISRIIKTVLTWMLIFPLVALILGGVWCLVAVAALQTSVIGLIWWAVRR